MEFGSNLDILEKLSPPMGFPKSEFEFQTPPLIFFQFFKIMMPPNSFGCELTCPIIYIYGKLEPGAEFNYEFCCSFPQNAHTAHPEL